MSLLATVGDVVLDDPKSAETYRKVRKSADLADITVF